MKKLLVVAAILAAGVSAPAFAHHHHRHHHDGGPAMGAGPAMGGVEVTERDAHHHATKVRIEGKEYDVCAGGKTDSCVNPRQAGLGFGNQPSANWTGKPASEMHH